MNLQIPLSEVNNLPFLTEPIRKYMLEACLVVLSENSHTRNHILMKVLHTETHDFTLILDDCELSPNALNSWDIENDATEKAAECIALLLFWRLTDHKSIIRSRRGTGFDYWIGDESEILFQKKARLEISGILKGDMSLLERRFKEKSKQTDVSDSWNYPAYISVTAFGQPLTKFNLKNL